MIMQNTLTTILYLLRKRLFNNLHFNMYLFLFENTTTVKSDIDSFDFLILNTEGNELSE